MKVFRLKQDMEIYGQTFKAGRIFYAAKGTDYGLARADSKALGITCVSYALNPCGGPTQVFPQDHMEEVDLDEMLGTKPSSDPLITRDHWKMHWSENELIDFIGKLENLRDTAKSRAEHYSNISSIAADYRVMGVNVDSMIDIMKGVM